MTNKEATAQPNILWIYGEDLSPDLACYGTPAVATPNIDRLASEGTRFSNAYVTCPVCSPTVSYTHLTLPTNREV